MCLVSYESLVKDKNIINVWVHQIMVMTNDYSNKSWTGIFAYPGLGNFFDSILTLIRKSMYKSNAWQKLMKCQMYMYYSIDWICWYMYMCTATIKGEVYNHQVCHRSSNFKCHHTCMYNVSFTKGKNQFYIGWTECTSIRTMAEQTTCIVVDSEI